MELRQKVLKGVAWSGAQVWGSRAISLLAFVMLSRLLTPKDFGLVAMASLFISFVQAIQDQGFGDAIVQRKHLQQEHLDTAFWTNLLMGCLLAFVGIGCSNIIADLFHQPELTPIIRWLSLSFIMAGLSSTQQAILRRQLDFKELAARSLFAVSLGGVVGVTLALLGFGIWSLVIQNLTSGLIGVVVLWRISDWRPGFHFSKTHFFELFSFGSNIIGINLLNFLNRHADDFLIGYFLGPTLLGFYTIAYRLLVVMTELLTSVTNAVAFPAFSRMQNDMEQIRYTFYRAIYYTSLISFPAFVGVAVIAPELIIIIFGSQWMLSIPVMRILAFIGILHSIFYFHGSMITALGKPSWRLGMAFINVVANIIAFTIAVRWGIVAVAAAYVIRGYLLSPAEFWMVRKIAGVDVKTYFKQLLVPLVGSLTMAIVIFGLKLIWVNTSKLELQFAIYVLIGFIVYLLTVRLLEPTFWSQILKLASIGVEAKSTD